MLPPHVNELPAIVPAGEGQGPIFETKTLVPLGEIRFGIVFAPKLNVPPK